MVTEGNRRQTSTLADIGITKKQSHVAQKLADIPQAEFRERIAVAGATFAGSSASSRRSPGTRSRCSIRADKSPPRVSVAGTEDHPASVVLKSGFRSSHSITHFLHDFVPVKQGRLAGFWAARMMAPFFTERR